jgi:hypothetical protein
MELMLQRSAPRNIYSQSSSPLVSPKLHTSVRPPSPDALELKIENKALKKLVYQLNMQLREEQNKSRRLEYRELLRKELQKEVLSAKGPDASEIRRKMIQEVNDEEEKDNNEAIFGPITAEAYIGEVGENKRGGGGKSRRNKRGGGGKSRRKTNRTRKRR